MVQSITLQESLWFSAVALLLGLITMRFRPELRRSVTVTLFIIVLGLAGLALLSRYQLIPAQLTIAVVPREICLLIVALGIIRVFITFLTSVLLARRAVPRILGEVSLAVALVVYALIRLDAVGVNPTSLIASDAPTLAALRTRFFLSSGPYHSHWFRPSDTRAFAAANGDLTLAIAPPESACCDQPAP